MSLPKHHLNRFEKILFVATGVAKRGNVPAQASFELMDKVQSRFRIGLMGTMMLFTVIGSFYAVHRGKKAVRVHKESVYTQNRDRYK